MPLSLTSEFTQHDIFSVRVYKEGKVYLLKGNGEDIVVKQEDIKTDNVAHFDLSKKAMGVVDKNVKSSKKLSENELNALLGWVVKQKTLVQFRLKDQIPGAASDLDQALANLRDPTKKLVWFKMPSLNMMNLQTALEQRHGEKMFVMGKGNEATDQSDKLFRQFLKVLKDPSGLESLGRIIAVDLFSGNGDRVVPGAYRKETLAGHTFAFKAIQNIGNILVIESGGKKSLTGMDFADPNSVLVEAEKSLSKQTEFVEWPGATLVDPAKRKKFAQDVISDLEMVFNTGKPKSFRDKLPGDKSALGGNAVKRLETGMVDGAKMLTKYVRNKMATKLKVYPPSFLERTKQYEAI